MNRTKKLFTVNLILILAIIAMVVCSVIFCVALKPTITEHDFPFSITYELDGKTETIDAVYSVRYAGNDGCRIGIEPHLHWDHTGCLTGVYKPFFQHRQELVCDRFVDQKDLLRITYTGTAGLCILNNV